MEKEAYSKKWNTVANLQFETSVFLVVITDVVNDFLKLDVFWHLYIVYCKEE
jgi:hypothetical protein